MSRKEDQIWPLSGTEVVGGFCALDDPAVFESATIALSIKGTDRVLEVHDYPDADTASGTEISKDLWDDAVDAGDAIALKKPVSGIPWAVMWVLRKGFHERERLFSHLRSEGVPHSSEQTRSQAIVTLDGLRGKVIAAQWSSRAVDQFWREWSAERFEKAKYRAEQAWLLDPQHEPGRTALYIYALQCNSEIDAADDIFALEKNSRGEAAARLVRGKLRELQPPEPLRRRVASEGGLLQRRTRPEHVIGEAA